MNNPYLDDTHTLIIPHDCDDRYRYWQGGQSVLDTLKELDAPPGVIANYWRDYGAQDTPTQETP